MSGVQVTSSDLSFLGHGSYRGGERSIALPANVELCLLQPVGTMLRVGLAQKLLQGRAVETLWLMDGSRQLENLSALGFPHVYPAGSLVPDLVLHDLGQAAGYFTTHAVGLQVVTVASDTSLSALLALPAAQQAINLAAQQGRVLRVYWMACASQVADPAQTKTVDG